MPTFLNILVTGVTVLFAVGSLWLAIWAWLRFRVSVFVWWLVGEIAALVTLQLAGAPDQERIKAVFEAFSKERHMDPAEMYLSLIALTNIIPVLTTACLGLIALGELSHLGPQITPNYEPGRVLRWVYGLRSMWGVLAVMFSILPAAAFYLSSLV